MTENNIVASVLIVDDNSDKRHALAAALDGLNVEIVTVASGLEALRKLLRQHFAVVLLDVNMPIMDGFETAALIRRRPSSEFLPIIFVTSEVFSEDSRLKGYEIGAVDYVIYPVLPQILRAKVETFVELQRLREQCTNYNKVLAEGHEQRKARQALQNYSEHLEEQVQARTAELLSNQALLGAIFKTTPNGLLLIDQQGKIRMTNKALDMMFGYQEAELIGQPLEGLVPFASPGKHKKLRAEFERQPLTRVMGEGLNLLGQRKDGSLFPIDVSLAQFTVNNEQFFQATVADITARKAAEDAMRDLNASLEQKVESRTAELAAANAAKREFLANMSHEIRTPMNAILTLAQMLEKEMVMPDQLDMVARIRKAGNSLLGIINDVLDFSKIEAGQLKIDRQLFALAPLLAQIISVMGPSASRKGIHLELESHVDDGAGTLIGDALRLEQILINLIGNAIKFTERGEVNLRVQLLARTKSAVSLRFEVRDTGVGIAQENIAALFTPFTQADSTITRRYGGTGLGLSICKSLIDLIGGRIGVESTLGLGSTFWFEMGFGCGAVQDGLPASLTQPKPVIEDGPRLSRLKCLLVDDSRMNRDVISRALVREGAHVTQAVDGQQALQYLRLHGGKGFDIVLMDMQMPVLDGLAATRAIRGELGLPALPIIAFTAGVMPEQRELARIAGCNDFLAKPVDLEELVAVFKRWSTAYTAEIPVSADELSQSIPDIPGLDTERVRSLLEDNQDLFLEILKGFIARFGTVAEDVRKDLAKGDLDRAAWRLHQLRGESGYIGAESLGQSSYSLEEAITRQTEDVEKLMSQFEQNLHQLLEASAPWLDEGTGQ